ncbi:M67 family metallopeptidase [Paenibacillus sp. NFR01]|uniref:M67 family metallopeptidase n=1 Tax=Paenibacillus sp. NFR01 TaxID=1566279 RepID=UPI0008C01245|nr:M67 family metallopeptidase [Paenibacillus sp. NFR01]SET01322.1 Proteasome lid subunit RPN8/RPN11, contains Jab1/MPN metalloenzyme (JAMM) motif [Paenibacillus sp. NFR01]
MSCQRQEYQAITMSSAVRGKLIKHMLDCLPQEACGVLVGTVEADGARINDYKPMANIAPDPQHFFLPDPRDWVQALYALPAPIGLFHTHPLAAPWPSAADIAGLSSLESSFSVYLIGAPEPGDDSSLQLNGFYIEKARMDNVSSEYLLRHVPIVPISKLKK